MEMNILLKKMREEKGLTIKQLAEKSGVGNGTIGDIERGANKARPATLEKIAKALELTQQEKKDLFNSLLPENIRGIKSIKSSSIKKNDEKELEKFVEEATLYFTDTSISENDKKKVLDTLTELFFEAKAMKKKGK